MHELKGHYLFIVGEWLDWLVLFGIGAWWVLNAYQYRKAKRQLIKDSEAVAELVETIREHRDRIKNLHDRLDAVVERAERKADV